MSIAAGPESMTTPIADIANGVPRETIVSSKFCGSYMKLRKIKAKLIFRSFNFKIIILQSQSSRTKAIIFDF